MLFINIYRFIICRYLIILNGTKVGKKNEKYYFNNKK